MKQLSHNTVATYPPRLYLLPSLAAREQIEYLNARATGTQLGNGLGGHNGCLVLGRG